MKKQLKKLTAVVSAAAVVAVGGIIGLSALADGEQTTLDIGKGSITITADSVSGYDSSGNVVTVANPDGYIITGTTTSNTITVSGTQKITLDNASIDVSGNANCTAFKIEDNNTGNVTVTLVGKNTLKSGEDCAGLQKNGDKNSTGTLTITGTGTLTAVGGEWGAGIGGGSEIDTANITIKDCTVNATGQFLGAGIGGGYMGDADNIVIENANVTAEGDSGIGTGNQGGDIDGIQIINSTVTATGSSGAGIGGSDDGGLNNLKISGSTVTATSSYASGIGGGKGGSTYWGGKCTNVTIDNSVVIATGGGGAGIGTGNAHSGICDSGDGFSTCSNITITNSVVTAKGSEGAAGIGGGYMGQCENVKIINSSVKAEGYDVPNIGWGKYYEYDGEMVDHYGKAVDATNGSKTVYLLTIANPTGAEVTIDGAAYAVANHSAADENDTKLYAYLAAGDHTITVGDVTTEYHYIVNAKNELVAVSTDLTITADSGELVYGEDYTYPAETGVLTVLSDKAMTISSASQTDNTIVVAKDVSANITLNGVNIDVSSLSNTAAFTIADDSKGNVTITLADGSVNTLKGGFKCAGLQKNGEYTETLGKLTITGSTGTLTAVGGDSGAGIGGGGYERSGSNITINGGTVTATGGNNGAGIGGGYDGSGSNITITGGTVTANGGNYGAGIGGASGSGSFITISGGKVEATGGNYGAGIGGGNKGSGSYITISGGTVTATGGNNAAGIGGGSNGFGSDITISGGNVTATGRITGAGIGGGAGSDGAGSRITINGGKVTANGGEEGGAGIGGGDGGYGSYITISDGTVEATGGNNGAGIGGGNGKYGSYITINGGTVTATGGNNAAGIGGGYGGGYNGSGSRIEISDGTVTANGGNYGAGIGGGSESSGSFITISGGKVEATGGDYGAGIGGGNKGSGSYITISGGTVTATGGNNAAGIGGGSNGFGSDITISGGNVTATGRITGAGIGGGKGKYGSYITINGGTVTATGGNGGAGIGGGSFGYGSGITISGGSVKAVAGSEDTNAIGGGYGEAAVTPTNGTDNVYLIELDSANTSLTIDGKSYPINHDEDGKVYAYLTEGDHTVIADSKTTTYRYLLNTENEIVAVGTAFTITADSGSLVYGEDYTYPAETGVLTILSDKAVTISGTTETDTIYVASDVSANITLAGVNIDVSSLSDTAAFKIADDSTGNVTITLADGSVNTLKSGYYCAGLQKNGDTSTGTLTIQGGANGTGTLTATSGARGAGIGGGQSGNGSNIKITGGTVTATGGAEGAGIGGGSNGYGSYIKITGGTVTATGGASGAGIGGGYYGYGSYIEITDGTVTAAGGDFGAGIGGGYYGYCSNIKITGGTVEATGGASGAGIGGGQNGYGSNIKITGGTVTATGGSESAGIGGATAYGSDITISDGTVTATGGAQGAGIGGGRCGKGSNITIKGGNVTANGGSESAGIGGGNGSEPGSDGSGSDITISGGVVTATGGTQGAGIGGGFCCSGSNIKISGGTVIATGTKGAGIGGGTNGSGSDITISGGVVTATGEMGAGIGGGNLGNGTNITISGGTVTAIGNPNSNGDGGAGIGGGWNCDGSNITITGGSVNAVTFAVTGGYDIGGYESSVTPTLADGTTSVYLLTIANPDSAEVVIDGVSYSPVNHKAADSEDTKLYAYLTSTDHTVKVGEVTTEYKFYDGIFLPVPKASDFSFIAPADLKYTGEAKTATITSGKTGMGEITAVKYFNANGDEVTQGADFVPGTYTVKIDVAKGDKYAEATDITAASWKFTITAGDLTASGTGVASGTFGDKLSELTVSGLTTKLGTTEVEGDWSLSGNDIPNVGDSGAYTATFTPSKNAAWYNELTAEVSLDIAQAGAPEIADIKLSYNWAATGEKTATVSGLPDNMGTVGTATIEITDENGIIKANSAVYGQGRLRFTLNGFASEKKDISATIKVALPTQNYKDIKFSVIVSITAKLDKDAPAASEFELSVDLQSDNTYTATITTALTGVEYSFDGENWSSTNTTAVAHGTTVTGYIRYAETDEYNASPYSSKTAATAHGTLTHHAAKAATCTEDGNIKYWTCDSCKLYFSDENGKTEITQAQTILTKLGHKWSEKYNFDKDGHWRICEVCGDKSDKEAHVSEGEATADSAEICNVCGYEIAPKLGQVAAPLFAPNGGTFTEAQTITITSATDSATIYYTTDGTEPTTSSAKYTGALTIGKTTTVKAIAVKDGMTDSSVITAEYTINLPVKETVATPVISPNGGIFSGSQTVTITCATEGAKIYYTTDGSAPTVNSKLYEGAFTISVTTTVKAIAVKDGMVDSEITAATFTKKSSGGGSSGGSSGGGSSRPTTPTEPNNPSIGGSAKSWSDVAADLGKLTTGSETTIELNGNTTVPVDVIKAIADKDSKVTLAIDSVYNWVVDGSKITTPAAADLTLTKTTGTKHDGLRGIEGTQFKINDTGIPTSLEIAFKTSHAGKFANLYKVVDGKQVFVTCAKLGEDGKVILPDVDEKGNYVVMLCEYSDRPGDMNNDGTMDVFDASAILKDLVELEKGKNPLMADFNCDGEMNVFDASAILKRLVGLA